MRLFVRWLGSASGTASVLQAHGVAAAVVPAAPERSVFNSVVYPDAAALERALPELAEAYEAAGVHAWTVWVPRGDRQAAELLQRAGHSFDGEPAAMVADLSQLAAPDLGDLDWSADASAEDVAHINDDAYGYDGEPFKRAIESLEGLNAYVARVDGVASCALVTAEHDGSAGVYFVATLPEARGRRLASRLLGRALLDARERGCATATLQATRMGAPIYGRLGFRTHGQIEMWERRSA